ncbi:MAG: hypothetical protein II937_14260 [Bacteroidales bacterium]|nr:hypothetical protein [Bacteroidales bacterium]
MKKLVLLFSIVVMPCILFAQSEDDSNAVIVLRRARQLAAQLGDYVSFMQDESETNTNRQHYRDAALKLFIGEGNTVIMNGERLEGSKVYLHNANTSATQSVKSCFSKLIIGYGNESRLSVLDCEFYVLLPSETKKVSENIFQFKAKYYNNSSDFKANRYEIVTITQPICMCCECEEPIILFGNIKVEITKQ